MNVAEKLIELGHKVDPIIFEYLEKGAASDFAEVLDHQIGVGGKRIRPALTLLTCRALGGNENDALRPAAMIELIHNYSLVMDDLIDRGEIRRGSPTVRTKYSDAFATLAGMFYREVLDEIVDECPRRIEMRYLMIHTIKETIEGERLDVLFEQAGRKESYLIQNRYRNVSWDDYMRMIEKKTAMLFRASCRAGALAVNADDQSLEALSEYGRKIGLAFQIIDDTLDIFGEKTGKQKAKDILEHKLGNAAMILALEELEKSEQQRLLKILRSERVTPPKVKTALAMINETNSQERCREEAHRLIEQGKNHLAFLKDSEDKTNLYALTDFFERRLY